MLIPFVCPICAGSNGAHLISLSRAAGMDCAVCGKWLKSADVMRAIHSPRVARAADAAPPSARPAANQSRRVAVTWPPTAESRANATPLRKQRSA
ncbi:MAG TPA: hypothetical protein VM370_11240 [Candidatus Thermoplasmatota archaeon]|nr:hypothetical protein [Candidatus Thermoplasmatota archaeon]